MRKWEKMHVNVNVFKSEVLHSTLLYFFFCHVECACIFETFLLNCWKCFYVRQLVQNFICFFTFCWWCELDEFQLSTDAMSRVGWWHCGNSRLITVDIYGLTGIYFIVQKRHKIKPNIPMETTLERSDPDTLARSFRSIDLLRVTQSHLQETEEEGIGDMCGPSCS